MHRTVRKAIEDARDQVGTALMPFLAAGYPDLKTTAASIESLAASGAAAIEIGIPFSDPIADGPTIQAAFTRSLSQGLRLDDVFSMTRSVNVSIPLIAMVSYSIVFRVGVDRFVGDAKRAGYSGLILPDLPPPEAASICDRVRAGGLDTILLVAPSTPEARRKEIVSLCSGFVYYLSVAGTTGERDALPADLESNVRGLKSLTDLPICVGFGIHRPQQVSDLSRFADGAIVGSAMVKRMQPGSPDIPGELGKYCRELLSLVNTNPR